MEIGTSTSALASAVSNDSLGTVQGQAQLLMLKKANEVQAQAAMALIQALPQAKPVEAGQPGALVNTYA